MLLLLAPLQASLLQMLGQDPEPFSFQGGFDCFMGRDDECRRMGIVLSNSDDDGGGGGDGGSAEFAPPPPSDDEEWLTDSSDEEGDPAREDAVLDEDWDTSAWSAQEIETACETLIEEVEAAEEEKRGAQATRMLLRLLARHKEAREYMETALESLVLKGTRTPEKKLGRSRLGRG